MIIPDYVEKNAWLYPDKTAVKMAGGRSCTFAGFKDRVYRLAGGLLHLGLKQGDRVAVLSENCFEYPEMYYGIAKSGGIITPLNFRFAPPEIAALTNEAGAGIFIVQDRYANKIQPVLSSMKTVKKIICIGDAPEGMIPYDELLSGSRAENPGLRPAMDDLFCLLHTGGTTGTPKLTMLTHRNLLNCAIFFIVETGFTHGDVFMVISPLFHGGAAWPMFWTLIMGNTFVILERFDIPVMAKAIEEDRVTSASWMSQLIPGIIDHPDVAGNTYDLRSLRLLFVGAAVLPEPPLRKLLDMFPGMCVANVGGQTECGIFTAIKLEEHIDRSPEKLLSAGRVGINMEIKIVDPDDNEVPAGVAGELCVRGEGVMKGYWNRPEESAWSLRGGWQHTGDICRLDEEGYLYYVDRLKDMIKSGGESVYSKEVEDVLLTHPAVSEAAVIGVPDEKWGEAVKALIILKERRNPDETDIIAHCKRQIAGFKCPKSIDFLHEFPRTGLGKIDKKKLREPYWAAMNRKG